MGGKGNGKGGGRGGRKGRGEPNWNNNALKQAFETFRPKSRGAWEPVLLRYQHLSGESELRDIDNSRRHWYQVCCGGFKKPTGESAPR